MQDQSPVKSPRAEAQDKIVDYLTTSGKWTAPYGILPGLDPIKKGKVRTITFGVARYLDCVCYIWTPNNITFEGHGPMSQHLSNKRFESTEAAIAHLKTLVHE